MHKTVVIFLVVGRYNDVIDIRMVEMTMMVENMGGKGNYRVSTKVEIGVFIPKDLILISMSTTIEKQSDIRIN